jgi:hypothetical protein
MGWVWIGIAYEMTCQLIVSWDVFSVLIYVSMYREYIGIVRTCILYVS